MVVSIFLLVASQLDSETTMNGKGLDKKSTYVLALSRLDTNQRVQEKDASR